VSKPSRSIDPAVLDRLHRYKEATNREKMSDAALIERAIKEFLDREAEKEAEEKARAWQRAQKD